MSIAKAEDWLKAVCEDALGSQIHVTTGPHEWDGSFLKHLLTQLPAVVIVWDGGAAQDGTSLTIDATWMLYVITGWKTGTQATRRREATTGAYAILTVLASRLHNENMGQRQYKADGSGQAVPNIPDLDELDGFGRIRVTDISNEGGGEWSERIGIAVYSMELEGNMPLLGPDSEGFDDYIRSRVSFDLPDVGEEFNPDTDTYGEDGDLALRVDHPQT